MWKVLQETCQELARNGLKKIILVNGHGGNNHFLHFFCQAQLESQRDYYVILFSPTTDPEVNRKINELRETKMGGHADEVETSMLLSHRPDLVHDDRGKNQSGQDLNLLKNIPYSYTGIWWYAKYPNHYAGDGSHANSKIGELLINSRVQQLVSLIKTSKKDRNIDELQNRFFKQSEKPLETKQD
ncbi:creatininase family protein [bacterium]|nr:creatininase family protein [bacterium]